MIPSASGEPQGAAIFFKDLTQIEHKEEQERLKDRLAALGEMAASLAHEIRNPLAAIDVSCKLLGRRLKAALAPVGLDPTAAGQVPELVNDVLLTICDAAVIRYFDDKGKAPDEPLVGYMPVNLRTREDADAGNLVSLLQVRLASDREDLLNALQEIHQSSLTAREVFSGFGRPAIQLYALTVALLSLFEETLRLSRVFKPVNNLVISNLPGPREPLFFRGAECLRAVPISTLAPMTALNVTANSYAGQTYNDDPKGRRVLVTWMRA